MFLKTHTAQDRLKIWRDIRKDDSLSLQQILETFSKTEPLPRYLDYYTPKSWPNPFEIISEGYLCQSGITLVLTATLLYKKILSEGELLLPVISNNINGNTGLVCIQDNQVYNFIPDQVVSRDYLLEHSTVFQNHKIHSDELFR